MLSSTVLRKHTPHIKYSLQIIPSWTEPNQKIPAKPQEWNSSSQKSQETMNGNHVQLETPCSWPDQTLSRGRRGLEKDTLYLYQEAFCSPQRGTWAKQTRGQEVEVTHRHRHSYLGIHRKEVTHTHTQAFLLGYKQVGRTGRGGSLQNPGMEPTLLLQACYSNSRFSWWDLFLYVFTSYNVSLLKRYRLAPKPLSKIVSFINTLIQIILTLSSISDTVPSGTQVHTHTHKAPKLSQKV